ncbi:MAG: hypothetical protein Q8K96_19315 [Rubrivivax sp.]|nr:hypothetical protein [Rubrivivax sp.]
MQVNFCLLASVLTVSLLVSPLTAHSQSKDMKDSDFALLPSFCKTRLRGNPQEWKPLMQRWGRDTFEDIHHHCFGLYFQNKARFASKKVDKAEFLRRSIGEFSYVLQQWPADTPLRPEAENAKRQSEFMLKFLK